LGCKANLLKKVISSDPFPSPFKDLSPTPRLGGAGSPPGGKGLINLNSELSPHLSWEKGQGDEEKVKIHRKLHDIS